MILDFPRVWQGLKSAIVVLVLRLVVMVVVLWGGGGGGVVVISFSVSVVEVGS